MSGTKSLKNLGYHIPDKDYILIDFLLRKVSAQPFNFFPIIDRELYFGNPWTLFRDDDPWDILNSVENSPLSKRRIFIFTELKFIKNSNRFVRRAGNGSWNGATGETDLVDKDDGRKIGGRSCFNFKSDFKENGEWTMTEYNLPNQSQVVKKIFKLVLCVITHSVHKDSEIRRRWQKSSLETCFEDFISRGVFEKADQQQDEGSVSNDEMQKMINGQDDLTQLVGSGDEDNRVGTISTVVRDNLDVRRQLPFLIDLVGKDYEDHNLTGLVSSDNHDVQDNEHDTELQFSLPGTIDQDKHKKNKKEKNSVVNAEESGTVSISTDSGNDDQTLNSIDLVGKGDDDNQVVTNNLDSRQ